MISSLTREQQKISGKAGSKIFLIIFIYLRIILRYIVDLYAAHIAKLEAESSNLRQKLEIISQESLHNDEVKQLIV